MTFATIAADTYAATESGLPRLNLGNAVSDIVDWITTTFADLFSVISTFFVWCYDTIDVFLSAPPFWSVIAVLVLLAYNVKGWKLSIGTLVGFTLVATMDQWGKAMDTLALVILASTVALLIGIPLGIWASRNERVSRTLRPILDFMQTMPAFVYLIPAVVIFRVGVVPGFVATVIFALAPGVRFTELGIRGVDQEVVEAGHAFGATEGRIMRQIQLPLALPTIMAGINQVIMLSLSMVVIAGMVGARGLGGDVVQALQRVDISLGFEAGVSVVILAMYLDRVTAALATRAPVAKALAAATA